MNLKIRLWQASSNRTIVIPGVWIHKYHSWLLQKMIHWLIDFDKFHDFALKILNCEQKKHFWTHSWHIIQCMVKRDYDNCFLCNRIGDIKYTFWEMNTNWKLSIQFLWQRIRAHHQQRHYLQYQHTWSLLCRDVLFVMAWFPMPPKTTLVSLLHC